MRKPRWLAILFSTLACAAMCGGAIARVSDRPTPAVAPAQSAWQTLDERWYTLEMAGARAGWSSFIFDQSGDHIRTRTSVQMKMGRGTAAVEIQVEMSFVETEDGKPVAIEYEQRMARQAVKQRWEFKDDKVVHTSWQGPRERTRELPAPTEEWMPPYAAERFARLQRQRGAEEFSYRTVNPEQGLKIITITSKRAGVVDPDGENGERAATVWKTSDDVLRIEATEHYDSTGKLVYQEVALGLAVMVSRISTKEEALAGGEGPAPELLVRSFITPDKPIDNPMKAVRAQLRLRTKDGPMPDLPSAGAQRVEIAGDARSALLRIDINNNLPASEAEARDESLSTPSVMVDYDDPLVLKLSERVEADADDPMALAEALRKFVHRHISRKGMATAFARASETAKMREGDCSEHGVLLCAMLRARGIPARVAMGLIYADAFEGHEGIFGWHMWTQALIDGKWVDFDATLPQRYNAVHILTNTSALGDSLEVQDMASILKLMGNLDVEVVSVEYE